MSRSSKLVVSILGVLVLLLVGLSTTVSAKSKKVDVCHIPPGNPFNFHTITVGAASVAAHFAHGDKKGECNAPCLCQELCTDITDAEITECKDANADDRAACDPLDKDCLQAADAKADECFKVAKDSDRACTLACVEEHGKCKIIKPPCPKGQLCKK